jgi:hypothetical protein
LIEKFLPKEISGIMPPIKIAAINNNACLSFSLILSRIRCPTPNRTNMLATTRSVNPKGIILSPLY